MGTIHNHYVPVYYLNGFANAATGLIYMYFKSGGKLLAAKPRSVANQLRYWSDETEKYLADSVESPANPVLDKIRRQQSLDDLDKWLLSGYIVTMLKRVPAGRKRMLERAPIAMKNMVANLESRLEEARNVDPSEAESIQRILSRIATSPKEFYEEFPEQVWERVVSPEMTPEIVKIIHEMTWTFLTYKGRRGFVTSDNPVVYTTRKGMRPPEGELIFPVSPTVALWTSWNQAKDRVYLSIGEDVVNEANYWTVAYAADYVFYSGHKNWLQALIKKVKRAANADL